MNPFKIQKYEAIENEGSLFDRTSAGPHQHRYGDETYNEDKDTYTHVCAESGST